MICLIGADDLRYMSMSTWYLSNLLSLWNAASYLTLVLNLVYLSALLFLP
jgi:hypothetical protein